MFRDFICVNLWRKFFCGAVFGRADAFLLGQSAASSRPRAEKRIDQFW